MTSHVVGERRAAKRDNRVERIVQVVCNAGRHLPQRRQPSRARHLLVPLAQRNTLLLGPALEPLRIHCRAPQQSDMLESDAKLPRQ